MSGTPTFSFGGVPDSCFQNPSEIPAFDTPPHELLKSKLFSYGIGGTTLNWINAFLCFRQQRVVVNGIKSDWAPVVSGVPQGTVLGPLLFSLYINDISADIESEIRLFADDCVCYREIKNEEDTLKLQRDIDRLGSWARKWGMRFQPVKCNMMQLTNKRSSKIQANYTLEGTVLENVESIKYLGVTMAPGRFAQKPVPPRTVRAKIIFRTGRFLPGRFAHFFQKLISRFYLSKVIN